MKKILLATIIDYNNYGNRLQNYALQELIRSLGYDVKTLLNEPLSLNARTRLKYKHPNPTAKDIAGLFSNRIKVLAGKNTKTPIDQKKSELRESRESIFLSFTNQNIKETSFKAYPDYYDNIPMDYFDYFVTGSDQVWNPNFRHGSPIDFLRFAPENKRIAYAPSFGINNIPIRFKRNYTKWLQEIPYLSVREQAGADIVKELTGRDIPVLADPTLILPRDKWLSISKRAKNRPDTQYLLTYFLGGPTAETRKNLEKLAKEKNMTIINLGDITEKETYETGPSEFLDYINNASAFFTDSFHGIVFSIIFQTPFIVYERISSGPSMYSRIETILNNFDMRDREANGFNENMFSMDFSGTHEVLEREYERSTKYLKDALRIEE